MFAELTDPDSELTATLATRNRLEGAALTLEGLTGSAATPAGTRAAGNP